MFSSGSFKISCISFIFWIHLVFILVCGISTWSNVIIFQIARQCPNTNYLRVSMYFLLSGLSWHLYSIQYESFICIGNPHPHCLGYVLFHSPLIIEALVYVLVFGKVCCGPGSCVLHGQIFAGFLVYFYMFCNAFHKNFKASFLTDWQQILRDDKWCVNGGVRYYPKRRDAFLFVNVYLKFWYLTVYMLKLTLWVLSFLGLWRLSSAARPPSLALFLPSLFPFYLLSLTIQDNVFSIITYSMLYLSSDRNRIFSEVVTA